MKWQKCPEDTECGVAGRRDRYESIVALRGIAAIAVLIFHAAIGVSSRFPDDDNVARLRSFTDFGVFGVDLFFVISGYCISVSVSRFCKERRSTWSFCGDRFVRILPLFWAVFAVSIALACIADLVAGREPLSHVTWRLDEWAAHLLLVDVFAGLTPAMDVTWTLSHELAFYAMAGAFIFFGTRPFTNCLFVLVLMAVTMASAGGFNTGYFLPVRFLPEFFCGVGVFLAVKNRKSALMVITIMCAIAAFFWGGRNLHTSDHPDLGVFALGEMPSRMTVAVMCAIFLIVLFPSDRQVAALACVRPLAFVGKISFSLYLVHVPVLTPMVNGLRKLGLAGAGGMWAMMTASIAVAMVAGWLLHLGVEIPIERLRRKLFAPQRRNLATSEG